MWLWINDYILFITRFVLNIHRRGVLTEFWYMTGTKWECCHLCVRVVYATEPFTSLECHFFRRHIRRVYVCLAVTCHLQNDRGLLRATVVTCGGGTDTEIRVSTESWKFLPPLLRGLELATFRSRVRRFNHWPIPAPQRILPDVWLRIVIPAFSWYYGHRYVAKCVLVCPSCLHAVSDVIHWRCELVDTMCIIFDRYAFVVTFEQ